ncbi:ABC transporter permease [Quadrisphaera sp. DSM 44207]|uniref:ABC transporter permease n=1 Tax=Quadrisphaera sp. DSM 44207 TaxID=1881057 RepID=UPI000B85C37A
MTPSPALAGVLVALVGVAVLALALARLPLRRAVVAAALRATAQLAGVALVLAAVLTSLAWTALWVAAMLAVAAATSSRRLGLPLRTPWAAVPVAAGAAPVLVLVLASGAVPAQPQSVLPVAGILVGGAMTATTLAGRRTADELGVRTGEYEAALSLGLPAREAALEVARPAAGLALVPALDQTRTVGLVTLPGAFVGVLLGGGSVVSAAAVQLLVLVGLLAAQALAVLVVVELVARRVLLAPDLAARLPT